ncbi:GRAM domain-containing protein [Pelosinus sp. sgz500959]|uniref:GRAM domain-containing protein n=1 Tax=Pelosinus sp. sgz500959 TaxID=3242472 RepID=UPI00366B4B42
MYSFPIETGENIIKKGLVSLQCDGEAFSGALYLTTERLVFVGYLLDITHKYMEEVPLAHIAELTKGKSLFVIPNVLNVLTIKERKLKFVVKGSGEWFDEINRQIQIIV